MKTSFLTLQGLPIGEPLSFLEVYIMSLNCAGAVIGGLFSSVFDEPKKPITLTYYHCNYCQQNFR